jgi:hypothetical protein
MKPTYFLLLLAAVSGFAQPAPQSQPADPANVVRDQEYGLKLTYPTGWQVRHSARWGKNQQENTFFFKPAWPFVSRPSVYYQPRSNFDSPAPGQEAAYFRYTAGTREAVRIAAGLREYKNREETYTLTQINGRPAFRYFARFTVNGQEHFEYFIRVLGEKMLVMFFTRGPLGERELMQEEVDRMSMTLQVL